MTRTVLHVDMDAFYASVEQRDHPHMRGRPVIVGADPRGGKGRGIVATCSYEARRFGIHSAQPISQAWRLCPGGIYVRPRMDRYAEVSQAIMAVCGEFTDLLEQVSVDEAFLDVTGSLRLFGHGEEIARKLKTRIRESEGLTASVGVAANKFVAKVASDLRKPDGLVLVPPGTEREFLDPLPVGRLWGVGPKTDLWLRRLGIERIGQLAAWDRADLVRRFGAMGQHLHELSHGLDDRPVSPDEGCKSIGHEITFDVDTADPGVLHATLLDLTGKVAQRLRANGSRARTVTVKLRESDFTTHTRRKSLVRPVDTEEQLFPVARRLMEALRRPGVPVRLIGVYGGNLESASASQLGLFAAEERKDERLAAALDDIGRRFGRSAIRRAAVVPGPGRTRGR